MRALLLGLVVAACGDDGSSAPPDAAPAKLVARYPMDDLANGRASDISGNMHHAMCTTCPSVDMGKTLSGFRFTGTQRMDIAAAAAFETPNAFSVGIWVFLDAAPGAMVCPVAKGTSWAICITPQLKITFGTTSTLGSIATAGWHHLAILYSGTTKLIFVDGVLAATDSGTVTFDAAGLTLGENFAGVVDELHVFDGLLTPAELATLSQ